MRRFANLARAEQNHANAIAALVRQLGAEPVTAHGREIETSTDLTAASAEGDAIERKVIATYDTLIQDATDPAMRAVFERIQEANHRHLRAVGGNSQDLPSRSSRGGGRRGRGLASGGR